MGSLQFGYVTIIFSKIFFNRSIIKYAEVGDGSYYISKIRSQILIWGDFAYHVGQNIGIMIILMPNIYK